MTSENNTQRGLSRRTVVKGAAWSVPVIAVAGATPAFASSGNPPRLVPGTPCKLPGGSCEKDGLSKFGYLFPFRIYNDSPKDIYIYAVDITATGTDLTFYVSQPPLPILIPAGESIPVLFNAEGEESSQEVFTAIVTVTWGHYAGDPDHDTIPVPVTVDSTNPCVDCTAPVVPVA